METIVEWRLDCRQMGHSGVALPIHIANVWQAKYGDQRVAGILFVSIKDSIGNELLTHWSGNVSISSSVISIDYKVAEIYKWKQEQKIILSPVKYPIPFASKVIVAPVSSDDWEVAELNASVLEDICLTQLRVVSVNSTFPIWPQPELPILCFIESIESESGAKVALLSNTTEFVIAPKVRDRSTNIGNEKDTCISVCQCQSLKSSLHYGSNALVVHPSYLNEMQWNESDIVKVTCPGAAYPLILQVKTDENLDSGQVGIVEEILVANKWPRFSLVTVEQGMPVVEWKSVQMNIRISYSLINGVWPPNCQSSESVLLTPNQVYCYLNGAARFSLLSSNHSTVPEFLLVPLKDLLQLAECRKGCIDMPVSLFTSMNKCLTSIKDLFDNRSWIEPVSVLLFGSKGSGRSTVLQHLSNQLCDSWNVIHYSCRQWQSLTLSSLSDQLVYISLQYNPLMKNLIILDDLDDACYQGNQESKNTRLSLIASKLSQCRDQGISLLISAVDKSLFEPLHLCSHLISSPQLTQHDRFEILQSLVPKDFEIDFSAWATKTHGLLLKDYRLLVNIAWQCSVHKQTSSRAPLLEDSDLNKSLRLIEAPMKKVADEQVLSMNDIGGLSSIKQILIETLQLPFKYAPIFEQWPIKLRSGLLLYGPSGCGKTLLAHTMGHKCGMHFISVKGPELLNKYIGSSEQAVRDLFARARQSAPCLLFFDEFDSIAPRRGHDSTGVTDRIVNQFLTELDGVEGRSGLFVLAASSRPDIIDPALLRPGRLDKSLYCGPPNEDERLEILRCITRKWRIDNDLSFNDIAKRTQGFSGSDLQALSHNSRLAAIRELDSISKSSAVNENRIVDRVCIQKLGDKVFIENNERLSVFCGIVQSNSKVEFDDQKQSVSVAQRHYEQALLTTRPSLKSAKQLMKYEQFSHGVPIVEPDRRLALM